MYGRSFTSPAAKLIMVYFSPFNSIMIVMAARMSIRLTSQTTSKLFHHDNPKHSSVLYS